MAVDQNGNPLGIIVPRVDAVWVTPEQMQMLFRASNGNVLAQCRKVAYTMEMALCCTICKERHSLQAVAQINAGNMIGGPIQRFLEAHKHPIVVDTPMPVGLPIANTNPVTRRIKETVNGD